jgi:hypothetical protein
MMTETRYAGQVLVLMDEATVILEGGQSIPVEQWFDVDGEDCGPDEAVSCVAGPDSENNWLAINLDALEDVSEQ